MCWVDGDVLVAVCMPSIAYPGTARQAENYVLRIMYALVDEGQLEEDELEEPYANVVGLGWFGLRYGGLSP